MDEQHIPSFMVGIDHRGEGKKIKQSFLTYKNVLIIYDENICNI
jgi:hypothetical protein